MTEPTSTSETQKKKIPVVSDFIDLFRVLISPGEVFAEQAEKPRWFGPWVALSIMCVLVGLLTAPYTRRIIDLSMVGVPEDRRALGLQIGMIIATVAIPISLLLISLIGALLMWVVLMMTGEKVRYRGLLSASMFSKMLFVLQLLATWAILKVRGSPNEAIRNIADSQVSIGADLLMPGDQPLGGMVKAILSSINPLTIWALIIAAVGVMVLEKQKKGPAWIAVLVSFLIGVLITGAMAGRQAAAGGG